MQENKWPGLTVTEEPGGMLHKQLVDHDGTILVDETVLPHDDLIRFMHTPVGEYHRRVTELYEHPLFEEAPKVFVRDYQDVISRCFAAVHDLRTDFPEAWFLMRDELERLAKRKGDGSDDFKCFLPLYHIL